MVLVLANSAKRPLDVVIAVADHPGDNTLSVTLPAESVSTFVIPMR